MTLDRIIIYRQSSFEDELFCRSFSLSLYIFLSISANIPLTKRNSLQGGKKFCFIFSFQLYFSALMIYSLIVMNLFNREQIVHKLQSFPMFRGSRDSIFPCNVILIERFRGGRGFTQDVFRLIFLHRKKELGITGITS